MGTVYEAEQDNPRRTVALKVIRPGLVGPALRRRFAQEAQILGRLHHPGVAQIYEAGLGEDGQPFFALEFIRGLPLDEYARRHGRSPPAVTASTRPPAWSCWPGCATPCSTPTSRASSTATSSRPTSWWTKAVSPRSSTSGSPALPTPTRGRARASPGPGS